MAIVTRDHVAEMRALYALGESIADIALQFETTPTAVERHLRASLQPGTRRRTRLSARDIEAMRVLHGQGHSLREIGRAFAVSQETVRLHLAAQGARLPSCARLRASTRRTTRSASTSTRTAGRPRHAS